MEDIVIVVRYSPQWPSQFETEKQAIIQMFGDVIKDIQHIGSTSIPGLSAKPIIDMLIGVEQVSMFSNRHITQLEDIGYEYRGEAGIPGRLFFRKGMPRTHHLHVVNFESENWQKYIHFRDYL